MARAAVGWGVRDLARIANVSSDTVSRLERGEQLRLRTLHDLRSVFETAGIEFLPDNGVRLKAQVAPLERQTSGGAPGSTRKPTAGKRAPAPKPKALRMSKEAQIRALREQGVDEI
jgi:transcriptional regulator with XRE-family HTH domain